MTPSKTEEPSRSRPARYSDMTDERMFSRYLLCALLLIFAYIGVMAVLDRFVSPWLERLCCSCLWLRLCSFWFGRDGFRKSRPPLSSPVFFRAAAISLHFRPGVRFEGYEQVCADPISPT